MRYFDRYSTDLKNMDLAYSEYSHFHLPLANMHDIASSLFRGLIGLLNYHSRNLPFGKAQTSLALYSLNRFVEISFDKPPVRQSSNKFGFALS